MITAESPLQHLASGRTRTKNLISKCKLLKLSYMSIKFTEGLIQMIWFCWYSGLISPSQILTGWAGTKDTNTVWDHLLCAHSSYLYHTEWTMCWYKKVFYRGPQCLCFSKNTHFQRSHICWLDSTGLLHDFFKNTIIIQPCPPAPCFAKTSLFMGNFWTPPFWKNFENSNLSFIKGGSPRTNIKLKIM